MSTCLDPFPLSDLFVFFFFFSCIVRVSTPRSLQDSAGDRKTKEAGVWEREGKSWENHGGSWGIWFSWRRRRGLRCHGLPLRPFPLCQPTSLISSVQQGERENRTDSTDVAGQCSIFFDRRIHLVIAITEPNRTDDTALHHLASSSSSSSTHLLDSSFFFFIFHFSTGDGHGGEEEKCIGRLGPRSESRHLLTGLSWENGCDFCTWCFGVV